MTTLKSKHRIAAWTRRPLLFASAIALLGCAAFGVALLLPVGLLSFALAAAGAIGAVAGLLTLAILAVARATGLSSQAALLAAEPPVAAVQPAVAAQPVPTATAMSSLEQPTEPLVLDLTDDSYRSLSR